MQFCFCYNYSEIELVRPNESKKGNDMRKQMYAALTVSATMVCLSSSADATRTMIGTTGSNGVLSKAIIWTAEDGGDAITPWQIGSNQCAYVIKSCAKASASSFPDVPVTFALETRMYTANGTIKVPNASVSAQCSQPISVNNNGTLTLNGNWKVETGAEFKLHANGVSESSVRNVKLLAADDSALSGDASTVVSYQYGSTASTAVWSTFTIGGDASAFKGKYVIKDAPVPSGRTRVTFASTSAFGDASSEKSDALTLGKRAYLELAPVVAQSESRGITIADGASGGVIVDNAEEWTLTAPVVCGTGSTFEKIGAGTVVLSGNQTGISSIAVTEGTLVLSALGKFSSGLAVTVADGAALVQHKQIASIDVTVADGGSYTKEIYYVVPYDASTDETDPLDFTTGIPESTPIGISLSEPIAMPFASAKTIEAARLPSGTAATVSDFADGTSRPDGLPVTSFSIVPRDGYDALLLHARPVAYSTAVVTNVNGTAVSWTSGDAAGPAFDYCLTNNVVQTSSAIAGEKFDGGLLTVPSGADVYLRVQKKFVEVPNMSVFGSLRILPNNSNVTNPSLKGENWSLASESAKLTVQARNIKEDMDIDMSLEAPIKGVGKLVAGTDFYREVQHVVIYGREHVVSILGDNSAFRGKIALSCEDSKYSPAYSETQPGVVAKFASADSFGGTLGEFAADALLVEHYSYVCPTQSMTLATANRGITVASGGFDVQDGIVLRIDEPLAVQGPMYKRGAGTLVLGGTCTASGGAKLHVRGGTLGFVGDCAVAGLDAEFSGGTTILLSPDTSAAENGFFGGFSVVGEGEPKVLVALDTGSPAYLAANKYTIPICTVPAAGADLSDSFTLVRTKGHKVSLQKEPVTVDGAEYTRYSVKYSRAGLICVLR